MASARACPSSPSWALAVAVPQRTPKTTAWRVMRTLISLPLSRHKPMAMLADRYGFKVIVQLGQDAPVRRVVQALSRRTGLSGKRLDDAIDLIKSGDNIAKFVVQLMRLGKNGSSQWKRQKKHDAVGLNFDNALNKPSHSSRRHIDVFNQ